MRISQYFTNINSKQKSIVAYLVAGDPDIQTSLEAMKLLVNQGVGIIEIGIPFSDTFAEGEIIQHAHERAIASGVGLKQVLELCTQFREWNQQTPIVLMGYSNSIIWFGYQKFAVQAKKAGVDGLLLVDMPDTIDTDLYRSLIEQDICFIRLISPTTSQQRAKDILKDASGFLYYVTLKGVTGSDSLDIKAARQDIINLKKVANIPVVAGFGIKNTETARQLLKDADGVVIGSEVVRRMQLGLPELENLIKDLDVLARSS